MTRIFLRLRINPNLIPTNPEERVKLWISIFEMLRIDLKLDAINDWGICNDGSAGYAFVEGDEEAVYRTIRKWTPYVNFDIKTSPHRRLTH